MKSVILRWSSIKVFLGNSIIMLILFLQIHKVHNYSLCVTYNVIRVKNAAFVFLYAKWLLNSCSICHHIDISKFDDLLHFEQHTLRAKSRLSRLYNESIYIYIYIYIYVRHSINYLRKLDSNLNFCDS